MDKYIDRFSVQLREAIRIGSVIPELKWDRQILQVLICGMGGSGIGGALVKEITQADIKVPVLLNRDYDLPAFANENTLVICSSYSGNTEETIANLQQAIERKCMVICITTGGEMERIATSHGIQTVMIPGGMPPRSCLGYSLVVQLYILYKTGCTTDQYIIQLPGAIKLLESSKDKIKSDAAEFGKTLQNTLPLIYTGAEHASIGVRWKQQINENSKMHCFAHEIPEMNHNELVSFHQPNDQLSVVLLRDHHDHQRIHKRFELVKELIAGKAGSVIEIYSEGDSQLERLFYFIHLGDWLSVYLAHANGVDPMKIEILDELKRRLGN